MTTISISKPASTRTVDAFFVWPRRRSTAGALIVLILVSAVLFFVVSQRSFFFLDDYIHFRLAQQRPFFLYILTPILGTYPAPGDRLLHYLLQWLAPLNFTVARMILLVFLAGTIVLLWQLVRAIARSDEWWTVAMVVPFALSVTLATATSWWSAGLPILPALFFTVVALSAWLRSYVDPKPTLWVGVAVIAEAAAGAFYIKFLLIPIYLLFFRLVIFPRLLDLPRGIGHLWRERMRWVAVAVPPAAYVAVYALSGIASRSARAGSRPYLEYFATAWFRALIPAAFMNARTDASAPPLSPLVVVLCSQVLFLGVVGATWRRSSLALRGWVLFLFVFVLNAGIVGVDRLAFYGIQIAYALRYYPEVILFLPLVLALGLRQGEERRRELAWERTGLGQTGIALMVGLYVLFFVLWAPGIVGDYQGVKAKSWYENLRHDIAAATVDGEAPRIVDSETPQYIMETWMEPTNRVSTVLSLVPLDVAYNQLSARTYLVRDDGHLAAAVFRPIAALLSGTTQANGVRIVGGGPVPSDGVCLGDRGRLLYRAGAIVTGERLAVRVFYSVKSRGAVAMQIQTDDPNRPSRSLELRPFQSNAELIDVETSRLRALTLELSPGDRVCIERLEIGSLTARGD